MKELHVFAGAVHGALSVLHFLGLMYNLRRKKWPGIVVHTVAAVYSANAIKNHAKAVSCFKSPLTPTGK